MAKKINKKAGLAKNNLEIPGIRQMNDLFVINTVTKLLKSKKSPEIVFSNICAEIAAAFKYPDYTSVRISFNSSVYTTKVFKETKWKLAHNFRTITDISGLVEVFYNESFEELDEGPFLFAERKLLTRLADAVCAHHNTNFVLNKGVEPDSIYSNELRPLNEDEPGLYSKKLLSKLLNQGNANRDIFHDLMPFKVTEVLLVATLYDAYSIEKEGRFTEQILGEYHQLNLTSMPRVTAVSGSEEALVQLKSKHFDMVIIMLGSDKKSPIELGEAINKEYDYIQTFLLLNNSSDIGHFQKNGISLDCFNKIFVWNGDSKVFFAMVKSIEDWINIENDIEVGMVGFILLVEDSPKYYSRYLPLLYSIVIDQTIRLIEEVNVDELYKVLRLRARPKILLASTYEEAMYVFEKYRDNMLCLVTDMKFDKEGVKTDNAGELLVKEIQSRTNDLAAVMQSSEIKNAKIAKELGVGFINKNSDSLIMDIKEFLNETLGFGDFIYRDKTGKAIDSAKSLSEFEQKLETIPNETLLYHASKNQFSQWLRARGEVHIARIIHPVHISDFSTSKDLRDFVSNIIQIFKHEQQQGKVVPFDESALKEKRNIISLASGALGGKGRGLAFINTLIYNIDFTSSLNDINIKTPQTFIIGTLEYEEFMSGNNLYSKAMESQDFNQIKDWFINGKLSDQLIANLRILLRVVNKPLAVRSSGLFEDSLTKPFAGIFETYKLPNNHPDFEIRLSQLVNAIKLVFASVFSGVAKSYIGAINHKIEEEKMAVIIQPVVGNKYEAIYYPHISGVAQSFNYYPYSYMKPEEGFSVAAVGLGKYVVGGEKAFRFAPKYAEMDLISPKDMIKNSQVEFYAVDLNKKELNLLEGEDAGLIKVDISVAEKQGTLKHSASVYNHNNETITPGLEQSGPRVINFANIFKYNYIPLAKTIDVLLNLVKEALGSPVEIEFAVDLNKDENGLATFYLLQIKPLIGLAQDYNLDRSQIDKSKSFLLSDKVMGNGIIDTISDVVYVDNENFDKTETLKMVEEIEAINQKMIDADKKYILIGPGRWGTRDRFIGVPVRWTQISNARVIVETSLKDFPLDSSFGSHFFNNVTSMSIGYFSVIPEISDSYIDYNKLNEQKLIAKGKYFRHVEFRKPVLVKMDGRNRIAVISIDE